MPTIPSRFSLRKRNDELCVESEFDRAIRSLDIMAPKEYLACIDRQFERERKEKERADSYTRRQRFGKINQIRLL